MAIAAPSGTKLSAVSHGSSSPLHYEDGSAAATIPIALWFISKSATKDSFHYA